MSSRNSGIGKHHCTSLPWNCSVSANTVVVVINTHVLTPGMTRGDPVGPPEHCIESEVPQT